MKCSACSCWARAIDPSGAMTATASAVAIKEKGRIIAAPPKVPGSPASDHLLLTAAGLWPNSLSCTVLEQAGDGADAVGDRSSPCDTAYSGTVGARQPPAGEQTDRLHAPPPGTCWPN